MITVIFEVWPAEGQKAEYLEIAKRLREDLTLVDGFISVERFQSLTDPDKLLSLSTFRDEAAVMAWRNLERHRSAQAVGRSGIFTDYRIRVTSVLRDYSMNEHREQAPDDSRERHGG